MKIFIEISKIILILSIFTLVNIYLKDYQKELFSFLLMPITTIIVVEKLIEKVKLYL